jgi:hypothetical protein
MTKVSLVLFAVVLFLPLRLLISADQSDRTFPEWTRLGIEVPGSVYGVLWYPGDHRSTASIQMFYIPVKGGKDSMQPPKTQVWLLGADGSVIPYIGQPSTGSIGGPGIQYHLMYRYDRAKAADAVAVAVLIEGRYFIKELPKMKTGP